MYTRKDSRIDSYISRSPEFTRPILNHIRDLVHQANPEIYETIKWGMPHFEHQGIICHMAAFKRHCALGFFKAPLLDDPHHLLSGKEGMGDFGKITSINDLPSDDVLIAYIQNAIRLNIEGIKLPKSVATEKKTIEIPFFIQDAINASAQAKSVFEKFSSSHKKEYIQWILDAKKEATRNNRLLQAIEWISEGKPRNWKSEKK